MLASVTVACSATVVFSAPVSILVFVLTPRKTLQAAIRQSICFINRSIRERV
jgi:hypothetical protein